MRVVIVTHDFNAGNALKTRLEQLGAEVETVYLDERFILNETRLPDVIVSDGSCRTSDPTGVSVPINFSEPEAVARLKRIPFVKLTSRVKKVIRQVKKAARHSN